MSTEHRSRAGVTLPNPQGPSSASEIEVLDVSSEKPLPKKPVSPQPPPQTWLTFLKRELQFLGVIQILIGLICLCLGIIVCAVLDISDFEEKIFLSFRAGYPFWGAVLFAVSGLLSIVSEKKKAVNLGRGSLGANAVSSIAAGIGIVILILNLSHSAAYISQCEDLQEDDTCFVASFTIEIVSVMLFLTVLGFCSAVSLTIYGIGEELDGNKVPDDRIYEELNIYSPIYSELEEKGETSSPVDS
ncbi:high affinity immunoglobulin epsilon receptor subunit beta [Perognathus longimembris pacificus]|uniref:high affinity immunoglobulin epsilon receptor subunit beta n=1 Tax=Perognathus longimembris pacificus TaxID=214514 RepID=UPI002019B731|nr:high affinity immunoglobulin epsilon receptor subunit beta [Perognathus longimembris pacificus]XP_048216176.1 high affinity immunoglobulin epsilon receptor subunit beta [Perognathus longimembris pacificus]